MAYVNQQLKVSWQPEDLAIVKMKQHIIRSKLGFGGAENFLNREVIIHVLQRLQALGEVLIIDFLECKIVTLRKENKLYHIKGFTPSGNIPRPCRIAGHYLRHLSPICRRASYA